MRSLIRWAWFLVAASLLFLGGYGLGEQDALRPYLSWMAQ